MHAVEVALRDVEEIGGVDDAGVVHENVERAELRDRCLHQRIDRFGVADIGRDEVRVRAQ
jgi:hypothetical protein